MDVVLQVLAGLLCLPLTALGLKSMLKPMSMLDDLAVDPRGAVGLNTIRGMMGGVLLSSAGMIAWGLYSGETVLLLAVAVLMAAIAVGRLLGVALDGFDKAVVRPIVIELVLVVLLVGIHLGAAV